MKTKNSFFYKNGLSVFFGTLFIITLFGQALTGWKEHNLEVSDKAGSEVPFFSYLTTGHFVQATFENWESEFLQMGLYVFCTVFLRQKGSAESKGLEGLEDVDRDLKPSKDAPWPVRKGGLWLSIYKNSLSIAFLFLFLVSFILHFSGSLKDFNDNQLLENKPVKTAMEYIGEPRFWFESFQNWQSEFLSIILIVVLTIFLRQKGSPESKPVAASNSHTGK